MASDVEGGGSVTTYTNIVTSLALGLVQTSDKQLMKGLCVHPGNTVALIQHKCVVAKNSAKVLSPAGCPAPARALLLDVVTWIRRLK